MKKNIYLRRNEEDKTRSEHLTLSQQNFKIYLRVKPTLSSQSNKEILKILGPSKVQIHSPYYSTTESNKQYSYEEVFHERINNQQVFNSTMITPITNALSGYNSTVFIYGMTGAGKTHTMFGNIGNATSKGLRTQEEGLVSMTIDYLFAQISKNPEIHTLINVSFYEIYNESIRDLLQDGPRSHQIMQDPVHGFIVQDLMEISLEDINHTKQTIISGIDRRSMNSTKSNLVSSRSHAILQFSIKRYIKTSADQNTMLQSKFFMIDLAGNEKTSINESQRFIQGVNINKSLLTLGKCLNLLAEKKNAYIPFRQSKLTRILKQSLGGNSKTVMIACVSAQRKFYEETLNTLKYSTIARKIKNKGIKHNVKVIQNSQIPQHNTHTHPNTHSESQQKLKTLLSEIISAIEEKSKIERLLEDLEQKRSENERMIHQKPEFLETWSNSINRIDETTDKLMKIYDKNMQKAQVSYQNLLILFTVKKQEKNKPKGLDVQNKEIARLQDIIAQQKKIIAELQQRNSINQESQYHQISVLQPLPVSCEITKIEQSNLSMPISRKLRTFNHSCSKDSQSQHSLPKNRKRLTINCTQEGTPRSLTREPSRQALHNRILNTGTHKEQTQENKFSKYGQQKEITISLNADIQLKSPQGKKQEFIRRLKQTEKKAKVLNSSAISCLLDEHQINKYELNSTEMSMLRKLKFFQRENRIREKSKNSNGSANRSSSMRPFCRR